MLPSAALKGGTVLPVPALAGEYWVRTRDGAIVGRLGTGSGPTTMDTAKMESLRGTLLERRERIEAELDQMGDEIRSFADTQEPDVGAKNHMADDGTNVFETERLATISDDLRDVLAQVNGALARMEDGTFGICQRCGQRVGEERLEAFPHVAFCIECQTILEREHALRAGR